MTAWTNHQSVHGGWAMWGDTATDSYVMIYDTCLGFIPYLAYIWYNPKFRPNGAEESSVVFDLPKNWILGI